MNEVIQKLPLAVLHISERNTRQPVRKDVLELARSLKTGQTTPAIARPLKGKPGHYELGAGSRRRIAAEQPEAGPLETLDVIIRDLSDADFEELILVENLQREDPDPKQEAILLERLAAMGVRTAEEISARLGKPKHWAIRRLQLLKVIPALRKAWESGDLAHYSVDMMELLGSLPVAMQEGYVEKRGSSFYVSYNLQRPKTRKELNALLQEDACDLGSAPFDLTDPRFYIKGCGPGCASDSSKQAALFDFAADKGVKKDCGRCLNTGCFMSRMALWRKTELDALTKKAGGAPLPFVRKDYNQGAFTVGDETIEPTYCWEAKIGKAPEGTKSVIVVSGGKMQLGYLPKKESSGSASDKKKLATPAEKIEMKHDALQARRWKLVHEQLLAALAKSVHTDCTGNIDNLVCVFGLPHHRSPDRNHEENWWFILDRVADRGYPLTGQHDHDSTTLAPDRMEALWSGLKSVLKDQLGGWYQVGQMLDVVPDMERVAQLISFPLTETKKAADLTIPPPKSWGAVDPHTLKPIAQIIAKPTTKPPAKPAPKPKAKKQLQPA